jgi:hypothetical protein
VETFGECRPCRLSRARRTIENAFGHLTNKFRLFRSPINLSLENATNVVKAATCLHNFLLKEGKQEYAAGLDGEDDDAQSIIPGQWEDLEEKRNMLDIERLAGNRTGGRFTKIAECCCVAIA